VQGEPHLSLVFLSSELPVRIVPERALDDEALYELCHRNRGLHR
jgi:hypothetical protein